MPRKRKLSFTLISKFNVTSKTILIHPSINNKIYLLKSLSFNLIFVCAGCARIYRIASSTEIVEEVTEKPIITVEEPAEFLTAIPRLKYTWTNQDKEPRVLRKQNVLRSIRKKKFQTLLDKDRKANTKEEPVPRKIDIAKFVMFPVIDRELFMIT